MKTMTSSQRLADITDVGLFEQLATAILRESNPLYANIVHTGVNVDGKTVKSPLDGICFVPEADPPHMISVHHTITGISGLEGKWLHDPSRVTPRRGGKPTAPAGDVLKTAEIIAQERASKPSLRATLVLTTNQEPDQALVRKVTAEGKRLGLEIEIWSRSSLAHFLDNKPCGQWLRKSYFGIEQELLSTALLASLCKQSLEIAAPHDKAEAWIPRSLDGALATALSRKITFVVGESGFGKTVACYRKLADHVALGGFALVMSDKVVADALTAEQAIAATLRQLHPSLSTTGPNALSLCSPERPLLLLVEDINKSGHAEAIVEKMVKWASNGDERLTEQGSLYRILCPLWPGTLALLNERTRRALDSLSVATAGFNHGEAREAVLVRSRVGGGFLTPLKAGEIADALGNDPLLIALHDPEMPAEPHQVIARFVEGACARFAARDGDHAPADFWQALRTLAEEMLTRRQIDLAWSEISEWPALHGERLRVISRAAHDGELLAFSGTPGAQRLAFRHDRVRDWLMADAVANLYQRDCLDDAILSEPFFAELIGAALVFGHPKAGYLDRVARTNPLALFKALKYWGQLRTAERDQALKAINEWLALPSTGHLANAHLRWEALATLAETDSIDVPALSRKFPDRITSGELGRLRNGDLGGGIELCAHMEPGVSAPWRDVQIEHAKLRHGLHLARALGDVLNREDLSDHERSGALRLAGHFADASLAPSIERCWLADSGRAGRLADYLWAFAHCCADDPVRYLKPVCDEWASLPDEHPEDEPKNKWALPPRTEVGADQLRWAFRRWPPLAALAYLVERGAQPELKWPMTCMLRGIDDPCVVRFLVHELAEVQTQLEGTDSISLFAMTAASDWRQDQERDGRSMSHASREALREIWVDRDRDQHSRYHAFKLWAVTIDHRDTALLRTVTETGKLGDEVLWHRLCIGDTRAIPALIEKLSADGAARYWWQAGRHIWSPELTEALGRSLERRRSQKKWFVSRICGRAVARVVCQVHDRARLRSLGRFESRRLFSW